MIALMVVLGIILSAAVIALIYWLLIWADVISDKCPACNRRKVKQISIEQQPDEIYVFRFECLACGHTFNHFYKDKE